MTGCGPCWTPTNQGRSKSQSEPFDISLPAVSKHLQVLERAGLLAQEKDGRVRRCQLVTGPLQVADDWISSYRHFWEAQFDALVDYLAQIESEAEEEVG